MYSSLRCDKEAYCTSTISYSSWSITFGLCRLNEEQEKQLSELNRNVTDAAVSADEHSKLLEQSQNDKATISRALTQNKMLKQQLEEMQNEFVKLVSRLKVGMVSSVSL